jgi:hypothetical protein
MATGSEAASALGSKSTAAAPALTRGQQQGYLTQYGDFFLGRTGQHCSSVCFSAGRSCSADLAVVGEDVFAALGLTCKPMPAQLLGATSTRYLFPGWISADENIYFGSCFNVEGSSGGGDVSCAEEWDSGSRVCRCPNEGCVHLTPFEWLRARVCTHV